MRALARPSFWLRMAWIALAVLHAWLMVRRLVSGELGSLLDFTRAGLALAAVYYCSLKVWRVATVFDREPRRALIFALALLLGHVWLHVEPAGSPSGTPVAVALILQTALPAFEGLALALLVLIPAAGAGQRAMRRMLLAITRLACRQSSALPRMLRALRQPPDIPWFLRVPPLRHALPPPSLA